MATAKQEAIQMIKNMPDDISLKAIVEQLHFKTQVDIGLKQIDEAAGSTEMLLNHFHRAHQFVQKFDE